MAICEALPGVTVSVTTDLSDLTEYEDPDQQDTARHAVGYIEAKAGEHFAIKIEADQGTPFLGNSIQFTISIDGDPVRPEVLLAEDCVGGDALFMCSGVRMEELKRWVFRRLDTTDERISKKGCEQYKDLGIIKVEAVHGNAARFHGYGGPVEDLELADVDDIPEKAVKGRAVSHTAGFGETVLKDHGDALTIFKALRGSIRPAATYTFKYCSHEALQALLILPRSPSPEAIEEKPFEELSMAELRELHRRAQEARAERQRPFRIERERRGGNQRRLKRDAY